MEVNPKDLTTILKMIEGGELSPQDGYQLIEKLEQVISQKEMYQSVLLTKPNHVQDISLHPISPSEPGEGEVQILVKAFSLNFGDLLCVKGLYPTMPDYPFTPGFEVSGIVIKIGSNVTRVKPGDEVIGLMGEKMGGQSSVVTTVEHLVVKKPSHITHEEACAFPIVFTTMYHIFETAKVQKGDKILIQTAAGGVGLIAVQLAQLIGAECYVTAGTQEKLNFLNHNFGVENLINYRQEDFATRIQEMTDGKGIDVVINTLSGDAIQKGLNILAPGGRYMEIAMTGLQSADKFDLSKLVNNQTFHSVDLRRLVAKQPELIQKYLDVMSKVLADGLVKPTVGKVFRMAQINEAYQWLEKRENIGKVVVLPEISDLASTLIDEYKTANEPKAKDTDALSVTALFTSGKDDKPFLKLESKQKVNSTDIAIIGISCRFPEADHVETFWSNISKGHSSIREVPSDRWSAKEFYDPDPKKMDKTYSKWGGFLKDVDRFDAFFFNMSGKEAELTDPQQRIFLEESWLALEDAGYSNAVMSNKKCAVFAGVGNSDYMMNTKDGIEPQSLWGTESSILPARISYFLNLKGPSVTVNTACSSSLVSIHLGCQSIRNGDSELALAGGVFISNTPYFHIAASNAGMLSPNGKCKTFDNKANGFVPGEGAGVVVLKSLDAAKRDGDRIYGVIKGSGINQDGKTNGITAPSTLSQTELELAVYRKANINSEDISYVEAHGTGTKLGDPIEIEALTNTFRKYTDKKQYCAIGSVKTNIGHTSAAAGVASVIKVLMALKYKQLPPSLNCDEYNQHIDFANSPFFVNKELRDWEQLDGKPRMAAVSSFGFSGTNAHLVIEEPPEIESTEQVDNKQNVSAYFIPISAKTENSLKQSVRNLHTWVEKQMEQGHSINLADLSYTLGQRRSHFPIRTAWVVRNIHELQTKLQKFDFVQEAVKSKSINNQEREQQKQLINSTRQLHSKETAYWEHLIQIANLYKKGNEIDWNTLFEAGNHHLISLPSYPFERERFWHTDRETENQRTRAFLHPLIEANTSSLKEQRFSTRFSGEEFIFRDHQVAGESIFPATAYIEMAHAAGELSNVGTITKLSNLTWMQPFCLSEDVAANQLHISLYPEQDGAIEFEVYSGEENAENLHAQGTLHYDTQAAVHEKEENILSLTNIKSRCEQILGSKALYEWFAEHSLDYGERFQTIAEIHLGVQEALAYLRVPNSESFKGKDYKLHPSILDGALQTLMGTMYGQKNNDGKTYLPFALDTIEIFHPITGNCYAFVTQVEKGSEKYNILLTDENGNILVRMQHLIVRELVSQTNKEQSHTSFYKPSWNIQGLSSELMEQTTGLKGDVLIFDTNDILYQEWAARIRDTPENIGNLILIKPGVKFEAIEENIYLLNPDENGQYNQLIETLKHKQIRPKFILHKWSHLGSKYDGQVLDDVLNKSIYSLVYLTQSLLRQSKDRESIQILYSYTSQGSANPAHVAVSSWLQTLVQENPSFRYKCIELENDITQSELWIQEFIVLQTQNETPNRVEQVRYSSGKRWVLMMNQREISVQKQENNSPVLLRSGGTYIITGGLGGLGVSFANYLAIHYQAKLVLVGRSPITPEQKVQLRGWEMTGAEIIYHQADIGKREDVYELVTMAKQKFGVINGIIHGAGVLRDGLIMKKSLADMKAVFAAKVYGTGWLDEATRKEPLDFLVLFSSLASVFGNVGQGDYAYANGYMDAYAFYREQMQSEGQCKGKTIALNWPSWQTKGMQLDPKMIQIIKERGLFPLTEQEGLDAFETVLSAKEGGQWIVLHGEQKNFKNLLHANTTENDVKQVLTIDQQKISQSTKFYQRKMQEYLIDMIAEETRIQISKIDVYESLETYGIDSAMIVNLTRVLESEFGNLSKTLFFEYQTIEELATYFVEQYSDQLYRLFSSGQLSAQIEHTEINNNVVAQSTEKELTKKTKRRRKRFIKESITTNELTENKSNDPIAIIGVSGRYPKADNLKEFWENLKQGKDCITEIPDGRWNTESSISDSKWGGFINDVDKFDPLFFNISPREAELMDPQERLFLQTVWHTLEDAGYTHTALKNSRTGVFVGVMYGQYQMYGTQNALKGEGFVPSSSYASIANRVSYYMDWHGPSIAVDTMCSSSLTALHLACKSIQEGEADFAIAGGVNISIHSYKYHLLSQSNFTSSDGRCRSFGQGGDGYVPGEGVGSVLLKPLSKAIADGDQVYAVIKGSALNHGGKTNGYTVPDPNAQANVIEDALQQARVKAEQISYIEAHGTGTALGDPIEIAGLKKAYQKQTDKKQYCAIGSVKSNIGHAESAAGIAAITKVLLQMKYQKLVPSLHADILNANIDFENSPFYVQREISDWIPQKATDDLRAPSKIAAISSFGAGGSNAHIILEEFSGNQTGQQEEAIIKQIFVLSAKQQESLKSYAKKLRNYVREASPQDFNRIAFTLQTGREAMVERIAIVASNLKELEDKLSSFVAGDTNVHGIYVGTLQSDSILDLFGRGKTAQEFVKGIMAEKESEEIAKLWSYGMDVNWNLLYPSFQPQRISLPVYPFKLERYWMDIEEEIPTVTTNSHITKSAFSSESKIDTSSLAPLTRKNLLKQVIDDLQKTVANLIKMDPEFMKINENLGNFGFDSITLKELSDQLSTLYNIEVSPTAFFEKSDIAGIADYLLEEFSEELRTFYQYNRNLGENEHIEIENQQIQSNLSSTVSKGSTSNEPIAIIGMSGMFPQSRNLDEYWNNLVNEKDMISKVPEDRWDWKEFSDKNSDLYSASSWGGFIEDVDKFDPRFFNISPYEAEMMDPQQRLALQTVWKTIEDAGYKASDYAGHNVGLFIGAQFQDYLQLLHDDGQFNAQMGTGNELSILVNRISYLLNFHGPSEPYNTACSSSSVAIHRAVQSIRSGESEVAIAGGVSLILAPYAMISADQMGILSPDGRCKTMSANANGYVKGEGIGMLMLKPLSKAIVDKDHIYSVIKGTAVNHGGKANSLTAPNSEAQANLLTRAYEEAGFDPETINYLELHGTGTELGDPVEIEGIKKAFKKLARNQGKQLTKQAYCGIGSVKTNIGHLEPASGIAGIMKVILAMQYKKFPGILHLNDVNPYVKLDNTPFYITDRTREWKRMTDDKGQEISRRAGVSSFGFGGVNAHIVLEEYEDVPSTVQINPGKRLFVFSAKNEERLVEHIQQFVDYIKLQTKNIKQSSISKGNFLKEIAEILSEIINVSPQDLDEFENFEDYGFGPEQLNRLIEELHARYELDIQPTMRLLNEYKTIQELSDFLQSIYEVDESENDILKANQHHMFARWAYTLQIGREEMDTRLACVASTPQELMMKLREYLIDKENVSGLYQGKVVSTNGLDELSSEQKTYVEQLLQNNELDKLAERWIKGEKIDWKKWYSKRSIQRISLPTYPFAKERYWAPKVQPKLNRDQSGQAVKEITVLEVAAVSEVGTVVSHQGIVQVLKGILAEKLKFDPSEIEVDMELSVYGVDSMLSSIIIQVVGERFGEQIDANIIAEYPTIAGLAEYILKEIKPMEINSVSTPSKSETNKPKYPPELIPINTRGNKQISFWFHGATGYSTVFRKLSQLLGPDYPMYAFQARGTDGKTMPHLFDDMVDHYYNCVRMIQPEGPYFFGGYSFGGLVAMEVARRLKSEGEEILHLIMFDTYPPTDEVNELFYGTYDFDFLKLFLVNALIKSDENPELLITNEVIKDVPRRLQISYLAKLAKEKSGTLIEIDEIYNFIKGGMLVSDYAEEAYAIHRPDQYDVSDVTFFKTTEGFISNTNPLGLPGVNILNDYDYSDYWVDKVNKNLDVFTVQCDHNSILEEPVLSEVAPKVLHLLDTCRSTNETMKRMETSVVQDASLLIQTFQDMGVFIVAGETYNDQELLEKLELSPMYTRLFNSWIELLACKGYVRKEEDKIITTDVVENI